MTAQLSERLHLQVIILAAGSASRFGSPKQLAALSGESLLARAVRTASDLVDHRFSVVIGANRSQLTPELIKINAPFIVNEGWESGPGSSIAIGIGAVPARADGVLLWHADQPLLTTTALTPLVRRWADHPQHVVASTYQETIGIPVIFPRRLFPSLTHLAPAHGAKALIEQDLDKIVVPLPEAATDIDTISDLAALAQSLDQA